MLLDVQYLVANCHLLHVGPTDAVESQDQEFEVPSCSTNLPSIIRSYYVKMRIFYAIKFYNQSRAEQTQSQGLETGTFVGETVT